MKQRSFVFKAMNQKEISQLNQELDILYKYRSEEIYHICATRNSGSSLGMILNRERFSGEYTVSAAIGVTAVTATVPFPFSFKQVLNINFTPICTTGTMFTVNLDNYTASSMGIFVNVTAALGAPRDFKFFWQATGVK